MKREIITMKASGMPLEEIEAILASSTLQGFPVVKSPIDSTVVGYIRRAELRFAAGRCSPAVQLLSARRLTAFDAFLRLQTKPNGPITSLATRPARSKFRRSTRRTSIGTRSRTRRRHTRLVRLERETAGSGTPRTSWTTLWRRRDGERTTMRILEPT